MTVVASEELYDIVYQQLTISGIFEEIDWKVDCQFPCAFTNN